MKKAVGLQGWIFLIAITTTCLFAVSNNVFAALYEFTNPNPSTAYAPSGNCPVPIEDNSKNKCGEKKSRCIYGFYRSSEEAFQAAYDFTEANKPISHGERLVSMGPECLEGNESCLCWRVTTAYPYTWFISDYFCSCENLPSVIIPDHELSDDTDGDNIPNQTDTYQDDQDRGFDLGGAQTRVEPYVCPQCLVSDPVSVINGNSYQTQEDILFPSAGRISFGLQRYYNSQSPYSGPFGAGWTHSYQVFLRSYLEINQTVFMKITDETGHGRYFRPIGNNVYKGTLSESTTVEWTGNGFIWHREDGREYTFDENGRLQQITDPIGNTIDLAYDPNGHLDTVTDTTTGRILSFNYNTDGPISNITGPVTAAVSEGIWVSYEYDTAGNLKTVTYADGSGFDYRYEDPNDLHNLTEKRNLAGHTLANWTYDAADRVIGSFTPDGQGVTIDYRAPGEVAVTDAYGVTKTYTIGKPGGRP